MKEQCKNSAEGHHPNELPIGLKVPSIQHIVTRFCLFSFCSGTSRDLEFLFSKDDKKDRDPRSKIMISCKKLFCDQSFDEYEYEI
jgi:hypothetical protein